MSIVTIPQLQRDSVKCKSSTAELVLPSQLSIALNFHRAQGMVGNWETHGVRCGKTNDNTETVVMVRTIMVIIVVATCKRKAQDSEQKQCSKATPIIASPKNSP